MHPRISIALTGSFLRFNYLELNDYFHFLGQPTSAADTWLNTWNTFPSIFRLEEVSNELLVLVVMKDDVACTVAFTCRRLALNSDPRHSTQEILNDEF